MQQLPKITHIVSVPDPHMCEALCVLELCHEDNKDDCWSMSTLNTYCTRASSCVDKHTFCMQCDGGYSVLALQTTRNLRGTNFSYNRQSIYTEIFQRVRKCTKQIM